MDDCFPVNRGRNLMEEKGRLYKDIVFLWLERNKHTQMKRLLYPLEENMCTSSFPRGS